MHGPVGFWDYVFPKEKGEVIYDLSFPLFNHGIGIAIAPVPTECNSRKYR